MKGKNAIVLNGVTVAAALQHYFDTVLFREGQAPKVTGVDQDHNLAGAFRISVEELGDKDLPKGHAP